MRYREARCHELSPREVIINKTDVTAVEFLDIGNSPIDNNVMNCNFPGRRHPRASISGRVVDNIFPKQRFRTNARCDNVPLFLVFLYIKVACGRGKA